VKFEVGDLVCARNNLRFYDGCGIIVELHSSWLKVIKVYWFNTEVVEWEQIYHLEAYCENWRSGSV